MADRNLTTVLRVRGRLCINPTDLSAAYPHGGTDLGLVKNIAIRHGQVNVPLTDEGLGVEVVEEVMTGEAYSLAAILRGYNSDAIATIFPNTAAGAVTGKQVVNTPGTFRAGDRQSTRAVKLCFSPDDLDNHPMFLLFNAIPRPQETLELALSTDSEYETAVVFVAVRDGSGRLSQSGQREDLTL